MKFAIFAVSVLLSLGMLTGCAQQQTKGSSSGLIGTTTDVRSNNKWAGIYEGVLPCNGCPGIQTTLTLRPDQTFSLASIYLGEAAGTEYSTEGHFVWNSGNIIDLSGGQLLELTPNEVHLLTSEGKRVTGELASSYRLIKMP